MKMWKTLLLLLCLSGYCCAGPLQSKRNIVQHQDAPLVKEAVSFEEEDSEDRRVPSSLPMMPTLTLPSNATSIRADITDSFSCDNKAYGYYADVENDCQIFHVCLPVTYADGKENTFRWSFICPEETIFSQDSFTCMRPEDMTIECVESFKYYELNRNFGAIEEDADKNPTPESSEDQQPAMTVRVELPVKPVAEEEEEEKIPEATSAPSAVEPLTEAKKPVKTIVPTRRKPVQLQAVLKKKPSSLNNLRKVPTVGNEPAAPSTQTVDPKPSEEEVKPLTNRFHKRPISASTPSIDNVRLQKPDNINPIRADLFNQVRKRPSYFNKKDSTAAPLSTPSEQKMEQKQPQLVEPQPTLNLESIFTPSYQAAPTPLQVTEEDGAVATSSDTVAQPSEAAAVYVKPAEEQIVAKPEGIENTNQFTTPQTQAPVDIPDNSERPVEVTIELDVPAKPEVPIKEIDNVKEVKPIVFPEAPSVPEAPVTKVEAAVEVEDSPTEVIVAGVENPVEEVAVEIDQDVAVEVAKPKPVVEVLISSESDNSDDIKAEKHAEENVEGANVVDETENQQNIPQEKENTVAELDPKKPEEIDSEPEPIASVDEPNAVESDAAAVKPIEAIEEIPAVIAEEQTQPEDAEEEQVEAESANKAPATDDDTTSIEVAAGDVPESEGSLEPTLEEMEEEKPANAIETMPATSEMQVPDPIVQAMFPNTLKQSSGGFKPVDPGMAAEAEALITDFLSTFMKSDTSNNKPIYPNESHPEVAAVDDIVEEVKAEIGQEAQDEDLSVKESSAEDGAVNADEEESKIVTQDSGAEKSEESEIIQEISNVAEDVVDAKATSETASKAAPQVVEAQTQMLKNEFPSSNMLMFNNFPDSMYHIPVKVISTPEEEEKNNAPASAVEEAKEAAEKQVGSIAAAEESQPQQEVASVYNPLSIDDVVELVKERLEQKPTAENEDVGEIIPSKQNLAEDQPIESQPSDEIIMPIYHRVINAAPSMLKGQIHQANEPKEVVTDPKQSQPTEEKHNASEDSDIQEELRTASAAADTHDSQEVQQKGAQLTENQSEAERNFRGRSMKNAKMDPRKRRFLFRSDAS